MQIITDSAGDLTQDEIRQWKIEIVPLTILFPNGDEVKAESITPDAFYDRLKAAFPQLPTTSQPSPGTFTTLYKAAEAGGALSIHVSSGLSGTPLTAKLAADQVALPNIHVIDTMTLSCGQRFQVLAAAMAVAKGWSFDKIRERLDKIRAATEVIFTLETLDYLARGGRIGRVQALAGTLLQVKPIIHVDKNDGKYTTVGRGRTMAQAITSITNHLKGMYSDQPLWTSVMHGQFHEKADQLAASLKSALKVERLDVLRISPVLGVHTGPGIVGVGAVPMALFEDLL